MVTETEMEIERATHCVRLGAQPQEVSGWKEKKRPRFGQNEKEHALTR